MNVSLKSRLKEKGFVLNDFNKKIKTKKKYKLYIYMLICQNSDYNHILEASIIILIILFYEFQAYIYFSSKINNIYLFII